jgi:glycosyltransferase involved in cell wall biosynthesis
MANRTSSPPTVSVIVPVWNVKPYLVQCLDSVVGQTLGLERIELIAVDDGSTDGSERILDEYAARYPQVVVSHEPNSGGPGRPRNIGIDRATGTYVFFLDADDYLGLEALERLVAMAERNESDIVLAKHVGIEGRRIYRRTGMFKQNVDRAEIEQVYRSGNVQKLFRRGFIVRSGMRFPEGVAGGEDGDVMARINLEASTISILADYDSYYIRRRPGSQTNRPDRKDDRVAYFARLEERIKVVAARRRPGIARDVLMFRHIRKMLRKFNGRWLASDPDERRRVFDAGAGVLERWHTPRIDKALAAWGAYHAYCLQHGLLAELEEMVGRSHATAYGDPLVEGGRIYARFPHFRDASGIPDRCFDITRELVPRHDLARAAVVDGILELSGQAYLGLLGGETDVELRRWPRGPAFGHVTTPLPTPELRDKTMRYPRAGYRAAIDLGTAADGRPLPPGTWGVWLSIGNARIRRSIPARPPRGGNAAARQRSEIVVKGGGLRTNAGGALRLQVGRPSVTDRVLERAEAVALRLNRRVARVLSVSRAGRLLGMALERARPGGGA